MTPEQPQITKPVVPTETAPKIENPTDTVETPKLKFEAAARTPEQDNAKEFLKLQSAELLDHSNKMAGSLNRWNDLRDSAQLIEGTPRGILQGANELREVFGTEKNYSRVTESANKMAKNFEISRNQEGNYDADLLKGLVYPAREMARVSADLRKNLQVEGGENSKEAVKCFDKNEW
jgi:hypothetical protein